MDRLFEGGVLENPEDARGAAVTAVVAAASGTTSEDHYLQAVMRPQPVIRSALAAVRSPCGVASWRKKDPGQGQCRGRRSDARASVKAR